MHGLISLETDSDGWTIIDSSARAVIQLRDGEVFVTEDAPGNDSGNECGGSRDEPVGGKVDVCVIGWPGRAGAILSVVATGQGQSRYWSGRSCQSRMKRLTERDSFQVPGEDIWLEGPWRQNERLPISNFQTCGRRKDG